MIQYISQYQKLIFVKLCVYVDNLCIVFGRIIFIAIGVKYLQI